MTSSSTRTTLLDAAVAPVVIVLVGLIASTDEFWLYLVTTGAIAYVLTASFNIIYGYAGIFSMAHVALYGVGSYTSVLLTMRADVPFILATAAAMAVSGAVGLALWWPTRNLRDLYLAIATLGFAVTAEELILKWTSITGGGQGMLGIPPAEIFGRQFLSGDLAFFWIAGVGALIAWEATRRLARSGLGRRMIAFRDAPVALASTGESPQRIRAIAFVVSGMLAGLAGSLFAHHTLFISSESFGLGRLIELVLAALLGGLGTRVGPLIGVAALIAIDELGASFVEWRELIFGVAIIALLGYVPGGIAGSLPNIWRRHPRTTDHRDSSAAHVPLEPPTDREPLTVEGVTVRFGGVRALHDVSFSVAPGDVIGLIGPNGAGKTTLLNSITGHVEPSAGRIATGSHELIGLRNHQVARLGIARTFQTPQLVPDESVIDNVVIGGAQRRTATTPEEVLDVGRSRRDGRRAYNHAWDLLERFNIDQLALQPSNSQPYSVSKFVEIARSMAMNPRFLLLDEPGAGLTDEERDQLVTAIRELAATGIGVVLIDHNVSFVSDACDRMIALDQGEVIAVGAADEVLASEQVVAAYLGGVVDVAE